MLEDVKICVNTRTEFFDKYYTVPENVKGEVDAFIKDVISLGEDSSGAMDFEGKFASQGLSDRFNALLVKCVPRPYEMTAEEKEYVKATKKEMFEENKEQIIKGIAADVADSLMVEAEEELIARRRRSMIEEGTFDEYTRVTNKIDDTKRIAGFFAGKFGKKKK